MKCYSLRENGCTFDTVEAESATAALDGFEPDHSDYGNDGCSGTQWTEVYAVNVDDSDDAESRTYVMDPPEPKCTSDDGEHDWQSPFTIVGGIKENPGVWGNGGGVIVTECCMQCGCKRVTDTWATDPTNGTQGHTTVAYEAGFFADELAAAKVEESD